MLFNLDQMMHMTGMQQKNASCFNFNYYILLKYSPAFHTITPRSVIGALAPRPGAGKASPSVRQTERLLRPGTGER